MTRRFEPSWELWRRELADASSAVDLRKRLISTADTLSRHLPRGSVSRSQWLELGVRVLGKGDLAAHGSCMYRPGSSIVLVHSENDYRRQRFTTAHEVGHLLLGRVRDNGRVTLDTILEERLCDEFAAALLIPPQEVRAFLHEHGHVDSPKIVLDIVRHFGVNLQPAVITLSRIWTDELRLLLIADRRGHVRRPDEIDYRVLATAGRPVQYIPTQQRLRSLGMSDLANWAHSGKIGDLGRGCSANVHLRFWTSQGEFRTGWLLGAISWEAIALRNGIVIALCALDQTTIRWNRLRVKRTRDS